MRNVVKLRLFFRFIAELFIASKKHFIRLRNTKKKIANMMIELCAQRVSFHNNVMTCKPKPYVPRS